MTTLAPIYLDNAATSPIDQRVRDAMDPWLACAGNPSNTSHAAGREALDAVEAAREHVANLVGSSPSGVIFTSGGTESNNLGLFGAAGDGCQVVAGAIEHPSVLEACSALEAHGHAVVLVEPAADGRIDPAAVDAEVGDGGGIVSVAWANNELGSINGVAAIAEVCARRGALLHVDAAQAAGKVDLSACAVDLITISGHKMHGPMGTGALVVREGVEVSAQHHGSGQERGRRSGTLNVPGIVGLGAAAAIASDQWEEDASRMEELRDQLECTIMDELDGVHRHGAVEARLCSIASLWFDGLGEDALVANLPGVACSAGAACGGGAESHVLAAIGASPSAVASTIRLSLGRQTTRSDIDGAAVFIIEAVKALRARL